MENLQILMLLNKKESFYIKNSGPFDVLYKIDISTSLVVTIIIYII